MLTKEKVEIYQIYKGYHDGYLIQQNGEEKLLSDIEWDILDNIIQDIYLIRNNKVSKKFELDKIEYIKENCDHIETFNLIFKLEKEING